ncbi:uncharacterized protein LOC127130117 [Lathyrus oleraceus]|uniref:uncharacterized protein LOC127130117 n=1 Tax=Pisum sativum TaxID=3888 RepID=UPI0021D04A78|nr:uncharacterized protein LOC127130117 [Pisum sativum]
MWNTLAATLRSKRRIIFHVASSGIESLLLLLRQLLGGRTTYSRFKIPVPTLESSICNINKKDELAELLQLTDIIIWDEAPMANKFCFKTLDKSLKDIMSENPEASKKLFGGKVRIFSEPNDDYVDISIPEEFLISNFSHPIEAIVGSTYLDLIHNSHDPNYLQSRAILTSTIEVINTSRIFFQEKKRNTSTLVMILLIDLQLQILMHLST